LVDCSLGKYPLDKKLWIREKPLCSALGISKLISDVPMNELGWPLVGSFRQRDRTAGLDRIGHWYLYQNRAKLPLLYLARAWKVIPDEKERLDYLKSSSFDPQREVVLERESGFESDPDKREVLPCLIIKNTPEEVTAQVRCPSDGILVFRSAIYPSWKLKIDGRSREDIIPVNEAFCGIFLKKGTHEARWYFGGTPAHFFEGLSALLALLLIFANGMAFRPGKRSRSSLP
jgi:hypothetical protein